MLVVDQIQLQMDIRYLKKKCINYYPVLSDFYFVIIGYFQCARTKISI